MKMSSSSHDQEGGGGCPVVVARRGGACGEEEVLPHANTHPRYVTAVVHNNKSNSNNDDDDDATGATTASAATRASSSSKLLSSIIGTTSSSSAAFVPLDAAFASTYRIGRVLGTGGFGEVSLVEHRETGHRFALKRISKFAATPAVFWASEDGAKAGANDVFTAARRQRILSEVEAMQRLQECLNVVHLYQAYEDEESVYLLMEMCSGGEVVKRVRSQQNNQEYVHSEESVARVMRTVLLTCMQCHARGIHHRDIKPSNFLYLTSAPGSPLKAVDLGLAVFYDAKAMAAYEELRASGKTASEIGSPSPLTLSDVGLDGSPWYQAPELLRGEPSPRSDVWSAGVMAYQLLCGDLPFNDRDHPDAPCISRVWRSVLFEEPKMERLTRLGVSEQAVDFVRMLLRRDVYARPTAADALRHPWLRDDGSTTALASSDTRRRAMPLNGEAIQRLQAFSATPERRQRALQAIAEEVMMRIESEADADADNDDDGQQQRVAERSSPDSSTSLPLQHRYPLPRATYDFVMGLPADRTGFVERSVVESALRESGYDITEDEMVQLWKLIRGAKPKQQQERDEQQPPLVGPKANDTVSSSELDGGGGGAQGRSSMRTLLERHTHGMHDDDQDRLNQPPSPRSDFMPRSTFVHDDDYDFVSRPRLMAALLDWSAIAASKEWIGIATKVFSKKQSATTTGKKLEENVASLEPVKEKEASEVISTLRACVAPMDLLPALHQSAAIAEGTARQGTLATAIAIPGAIAGEVRGQQISKRSIRGRIGGSVGGAEKRRSVGSLSGHSEDSPPGRGRWSLLDSPGSPRDVGLLSDDVQQRGAQHFGVPDIDNDRARPLPSRSLRSSAGSFDQPKETFQDQIARLPTATTGDSDSSGHDHSTMRRLMFDIDGTNTSEGSTYRSRRIAKVLRIASLADLGKYEARMASPLVRETQHILPGSPRQQHLPPAAVREVEPPAVVVPKVECALDQPQQQSSTDGPMLSSLLGITPERLF